MSKQAYEWFGLDQKIESSASVFCGILKLLSVVMNMMDVFKTVCSKNNEGMPTVQALGMIMSD